MTKMLTEEMQTQILSDVANCIVLTVIATAKEEDKEIMSKIMGCLADITRTVSGEEGIRAVDRALCQFFDEETDNTSIEGEQNV